MADIQALLPGITNAAQDRTITNTYDVLNRLKDTKQSAVYNFDSTTAQYFTASPTTRNTYNAFGQLIKQSTLRNLGADNAANTSDDKWIDAYTYYNQRGEKIGQVDSLGYLTAYQYDAEGNVTQQTEYASALTYTVNTTLSAGQNNSSSFSAVTTVPVTAQSIRNIGFDRTTRSS